MISLLSKSVTGGLVLLWLSGIGFLIHYAFFNPTLLANPKVWAKIAIVGVLSLNGIFIHRVVLPLISQRIGRPMFEGMTSFQRTCLLASGAISGMSWWIPLVLGAFPQLNFTIAAQTILLAYAVLLTFAIISASLVVRYVLPQLATITLPRAEYNALISRLKAQAREARSSAQARNADGIASGIFEQRNNAGNGSALRTFGSARRNAGSATRYKAAGVGALRMALPAFAVLGVFAYLSYAFLAPISSLRFDNDAHASVLAEQQHTSVGFQLASSAEQLVPEQRSAGEPPAFIHAVAPAVPEPQSEGPILTANAKGNERTPQRQVPTKAGYVDIWGADAEACSAKSSPAQSLSAQSASNDHLPTVISEDGATAGDTFCGFEKVKLAGSSWQVLAQCSDGQERWTSAVRLTVKGDRLTWTSQRGNRTYRRCEQAMMLVTAPDK